MSTKTLGWLVRARDGKKLGSSWDSVKFIPTLSQPGPFQSFAETNYCLLFTLYSKPLLVHSTKFFNVEQNAQFKRKV